MRFIVVFTLPSRMFRTIMAAMEVVITLIVVGALLIFLETILPGLIAGVVGFGCLVAAVIIAYARVGTSAGHVVLATVILGFILGAILYLRYFPGSRTARLFTSQGASGDTGVDKSVFLHQTGRAATPLRPSGAAVINGQRVDVVAEGPMIEKDTPVRVVLVEGSRVVVRAVDSETTKQ